MDPNSPNAPGYRRRVARSAELAEAPISMDDEAFYRMIQLFGPAEYTQYRFGNPLERQTLAAQSKTPVNIEQDKQFKGEYLLPGMLNSEQSIPGSSNSPESPGTPVSKIKESILEWFDKAVEVELEKRRDKLPPPTLPTADLIDPAISTVKSKLGRTPEKIQERVTETTASRIEIESRLDSDFTTELSDAVEKLAKAETMCAYNKSLEAAEEAAQKAPPELAEQAAMAGARQFATDIKTMKIEKTLDYGVRPIEVIGYVGVTKPRDPKKP